MFTRKAKDAVLAPAFRTLGHDHASKVALFGARVVLDGQLEGDHPAGRTPGQGEPVIDLMVDDVDETHHLLKKKGVRVIRDPEDAVWGGRFAVIADPDGNTLQIVQINWGKYYKAAALSINN